MEIRSRIKGLRTVKASDLKVNPGNYRTHPEYQRGVIRGLLGEIGYVDALLAVERDGQLILVDGQMRKEESGDAMVPVLICDLTDAEVQKVLLTLDPVTALAENDEQLRRKLLEAVSTQDADVQRMLADQRAEMDKALEENPGTGRNEQQSQTNVAAMALQPHEHYDYLVVLCTTASEWNMLCERLGLKPEPRIDGAIGTSRAIRATRLLHVLIGDKSE